MMGTTTAVQLIGWQQMDFAEMRLMTSVTGVIDSIRLFTSVHFCLQLILRNQLIPTYHCTFAAIQLAEKLQ